MFKSKKKLIQNPSIPVTIKHLKKHYKDSLPQSWRTLFQVLEYVHDQRNRIVHHIIPEELGVSVSVAAWAHLGLIRSISDKYGIAPDDFIEETLFDLIKSHRLEPYMKFVEASLAERYPDSAIYPCPACGMKAVSSYHCEACFISLSTRTCDNCGMEGLYIDDPNLAEYNICSSCGKNV